MLVVQLCKYLLILTTTNGTAALQLIQLTVGSFKLKESANHCDKAVFTLKRYMYEQVATTKIECLVNSSL